MTPSQKEDPAVLMDNEERIHATLLKEYETARSTYNQLESNIWQTAAVFMVISLGGVSILFTLIVHSWANFVGVTGVGLISVFVLWYWSGTVDRWLGLEAVLLYRMRGIETAPGPSTNCLDRQRSIVCTRNSQTFLSTLIK